MSAVFGFLFGLAVYTVVSMFIESIPVRLVLSFLIIAAVLIAFPPGALS